jgi:hypothetical protein
MTTFRARFSCTIDIVADTIEEAKQRALECSWELDEYGYYDFTGISEIDESDAELVIYADVKNLKQ